MYSETLYAEPAEPERDRPRVGDRVKLFGNHRWAGHTGVYVFDRPADSGITKPYVRIDNDGTETVVFDPENQMRKV